MPLRKNNLLVFTRGGGQLLGIFMNFHFFDSTIYTFPNVLEWAKTVFHNILSTSCIFCSLFNWFVCFPRIYVVPQKKQKKKFFWFFGFFEFFFSLFSRGCNYSDNSGSRCFSTMYCHKLSTKQQNYPHNNYNLLQKYHTNPFLHYFRQ